MTAAQDVIANADLANVISLLPMQLHVICIMPCSLASHETWELFSKLSHLSNGYFLVHAEIKATQSDVNVMLYAYSQHRQQAQVCMDDGSGQGLVALRLFMACPWAHGTRCIILKLILLALPSLYRA